MPPALNQRLERRQMPLEIREAVNGSNGRQRWATAVTYGTVDDFGSTWRPGVFTAALAERMPTILWGHDWWSLDHVLGQGIDSRETDTGVDVLLEFADPDAIPAAGRALHLVETRVIRDVSVGFERFEWVERDQLSDDERQMGATEAIVRAGMDELSLVVRGAVPGASMRQRPKVSFRSGVVDLDAVVEIGRRKAAGELTSEEAHAAVELLMSGPDTAPSADQQDVDESTAAADEAERVAELEALDAEAAATIAYLNFS